MTNNACSDITNGIVAIYSVNLSNNPTTLIYVTHERLKQFNIIICFKSAKYVIRYRISHIHVCRYFFFFITELSLNIVILNLHLIIYLLTFLVKYVIPYRINGMYEYSIYIHHLLLKCL